ncbi:phytase [Microbulbifer sp. ZKSA006]|uniref:phytase n=1 Tax=Microbulbifer sp. ZKSA006 TaxID=3243390 RepID=UPI00403A3F4D
MRFSIVGVLSCVVFLGCDVGTDSKNLSSQKPTSLNGVIAEQILPINFFEQRYLLLSSETQGLLLVDEFAEVQAQQPGSIEALAIQPRGDGNYLIAAYEEQAAQLQLYQLFAGMGSALRFELLGKFENFAPVSALCFAVQEGRNHLFVIGESGLGFEYLLTASGAGWDLTEIRPLYLGEGVNSCAVDSRRGRLLVSQPPLGVLALNADAESDEARELLLSTEQLGDEFGSLRLDYQRDQIWLLVQQGIVAFDLSGGGSLDQSWAFPGKGAASLAAFNDRLALLEDSQREVVYIPISTKLVQATADSLEAVPVIWATGETDPVYSSGDAADDPAIWVNSHSPENSLIFATDKKRGLNIYHLSGGLKQNFPLGKLNNVDIRKISHPHMDAIAVASNRTDPGLDIFAIRTNGEVEHLGYRSIDLSDPYGLCLQQDDDGLYAWVSDKGSSLHQFKLKIPKLAKGIEIERGIRLDNYAQIEGCVVDDQFATLFFAEEERGIWRLDLNAGAEVAPVLVAEVDGKQLVADVEGLALYQANKKGYLMASSQGSDTYALFSRDGSEFLTQFKVGINPQLGIDGSSETDGLAITSANLGAQYPQGLLVVQDGRNRMPRARQNFKLIDWRDINLLLLQQ